MGRTGPRPGQDRPLLLQWHQPRRAPPATGALHGVDGAPAQLHPGGGGHRECRRPAHGLRAGHTLRARLVPGPSRERAAHRPAHGGARLAAASLCDATHAHPGPHGAGAAGRGAAGHAGAPHQRRRAAAVPGASPPACRGGAGHRQPAGRHHQPARLLRALRPALYPRPVRAQSMLDVHEPRPCAGGRAYVDRPAQPRAAVRRPALSGRWLRHHARRPLRQPGHRRSAGALGHRNAPRSRALRQPADLAAGQHPHQPAHRPPA